MHTYIHLYILVCTFIDICEAELAKRPLGFEIFRKEHGEIYKSRHIPLGETYCYKNEEKNYS